MLKLGLSYEFIEGLVFIELSLIIVLIVMTYTLGLLKKRRSQLGQAKAHQLKDMMIAIPNLHIHSDSQIKDYFAPYHKLFKMSRFLPIYIRLDAKYAHNANWQLAKKYFIDNVLTKFAKRNWNSKKWVKRLYTAEIFAHIATLADEDKVVALVKDKRKIIYLHSIHAAILIGTEKTILAVLQRIALESWLVQTIYTSQFSKLSTSSLNVLKDILVNTEIHHIKAICYHILLKFPPVNVPGNIDDIYSNHFELTSAALKYLVHCKSDESVNILRKFLFHNDWRLRVIAVNRLGVLKATTTLEDVAKLLNDPEWWVEVSAAITLQQFGDAGIKKLLAMKPALINFNFKINQYLHYILW